MAASRSCGAAILILWDACIGGKGSENAMALPSLLKQSCMPTVNIWHRESSRQSCLQTALMNQLWETQ